MSVPDYVVRIAGKSFDGRAFNGTGFFVDKKGLIATCLHVAMPEGKTPQELWVEFGLSRKWQCELQPVNTIQDLALLTTVVPIGEETPFAPLDADWRSTTKEGDEVSVWGFSAAEHYASPQKFTCRVSGFAGEYGRIGLNGSINPGDSGAPVVNGKGFVIGVAQLRDQKREGQAMAIPISLLIGMIPDPIIQGNPYRGLEYFDLEHSGFFFGREALIDELLNKLKTAPGGPENRFLGLVGPVGSGKSSLARAGLLASIRRGGLPGSETWPIAICRPGTDPLESLAIALASAHKTEMTPAAIRAQVQEFRASDRTLHLTSRLASKDLSAGRRAVVLVDQFEEVFSQCRDETDRQAFIDNLITAANEPAGQTIVVLTLRADFYGECASHPRLAAALSGHQILVGPMGEAELQRAIECPAERAGAEFEHGLVDLLIDDVRGQPGSLPLLQYSLSELWQFREGNKLTLAAYQAIGKVSGAVERRAEEVYLQFSEPEQLALRRILLRLVQSTEGGKATRRSVRFEDLLPAEGDAGQVEKVVDRMADSPVRLLTIEDSGPFAASPAAGGRSHRYGQTVDIAHEALIRSWKRLAQWLDEDREFQLWQKRLTASLAEWEQSARHEDALLRGKLLLEAKDWLETRRGDLNRAEQEFIRAGLAAEKAKAEKEARFNLALKVLASVLALLFIAAAAAAVFARHEARVAKSLALAGTSEDNMRDPDLALILALHAFSNSETPEAEQALHHAMRTMRGIGFPASGDGSVVLGMAYSAVPHLLATANSDNSIALWNVETKDRYAPAINVDAGVRNVSFLPAGKGLAVATSDGRVEIFGLSGTRLPPEIKLAAATQINSAEFNPAGNMLLIGTQDPSLPSAIRPYPNGPFRQLSGQTGPVRAAHFTPDGKSLITASVDGTVFVWDSGSGQKIFTLEAQGEKGEAHLRQLICLAASPDGRIAAAGDTSGSIHVWDLRSRHPIGRLLHSNNAQVRGLAFSGDGRTMASASQDGTIKLWNVSGNNIVERTSILCGKPLAPEKTDREGCTALLFIDEHTLEAADRDGDVRQYETDLTRLISQARNLVDLPHLRPDSLEACKKYLRKATCDLP